MPLTSDFWANSWRVRTFPHPQRGWAFGGGANHDGPLTPFRTELVLQKAPHLPIAFPDHADYSDIRRVVPRHGAQQGALADAATAKDPDALPFSARQEGVNRPDPGHERLSDVFPIQRIGRRAIQSIGVLRLDRRRMTVLEALDFLDTLVDDSDPDTSLSQREHLLQSAEAIRADGHEDWFVLVGLIHDLGKVLCLFGEPQWAVVGDTFPVCCRWSPKIVHSQFFSLNPDKDVAQYQTENGIYEPGCGLDNVHMSWGHD